jgi:hypothetical protein
MAALVRFSKYTPVVPADIVKFPVVPVLPLRVPVVKMTFAPKVDTAIIPGVALTRAAKMPFG